MPKRTHHLGSVRLWPPDPTYIEPDPHFRQNPGRIPLHSPPPQAPFFGDLRPSPAWQAADPSLNPPDLLTGYSSHAAPRRRWLSALRSAAPRRSLPNSDGLHPASIHCVLLNGAWIWREAHLRCLAEGGAVCPESEHCGGCTTASLTRQGGGAQPLHVR